MGKRLGTFCSHAILLTYYWHALCGYLLLRQSGGWHFRYMYYMYASFFLWELLFLSNCCTKIFLIVLFWMKLLFVIYFVRHLPMIIFFCLQSNEWRGWTWRCNDATCTVFMFCYTHHQIALMSCYVINNTSLVCYEKFTFFFPTTRYSAELRLLGLKRLENLIFGKPTGENLFVWTKWVVPMTKWQPVAIWLLSTLTQTPSPPPRLSPCPTHTHTHQCHSGCCKGVQGQRNTTEGPHY